MKIFWDFYISCFSFYLLDCQSFNHTSANLENKKKWIFWMFLQLAKLQEWTIFQTQYLRTISYKSINFFDPFGKYLLIFWYTTVLANKVINNHKRFCWEISYPWSINGLKGTLVIHMEGHLKWRPHSHGNISFVFYLFQYLSSYLYPLLNVLNNIQISLNKEGKFNNHPSP